MQFLFSNPMLLLAVPIAIMAFFAFKFAKPKPKSKAKDADKTQTEKKEGSDSSEASAETAASEDNGKPKKKKLRKPKPEISHVYEKKQMQTKVTSETNDDKSKLEEEFLKKMQFVKSSGKVSRLKPYEASSAAEEVAEIQEVGIDEPLVEVKQEKKSRFDRTRRLSNMIQSDSLDDLFCSHISEKYMNMDDIARHISSCDEIEAKLFERAAKTMANSEAKVNISDDGKIAELKDKDSMKAWLEERRRQELAKFMVNSNVENNIVSNQDDDFQDDEQGIDLDSRTILVVDSILKRKGKKQ